VRTLHRHDRKQIDFVTGFGDLHRRSQSGEAATHDCDFDWSSHLD
jgi:hypothetical protein